jgi:hypothetical protein
MRALAVADREREAVHIRPPFGRWHAVRLRHALRTKVSRCAIPASVKSTAKTAFSFG